MKHLFTTTLLLAAAGCSTTTTTTATAPANSKTETVMVTYHVQVGQADGFQTLLAHAWDVYRSEGMVDSTPHTVIQGSEDGGRPYFVEIFTWKQAPDNPSANVKDVWKQEQALVESRDGHTGIDGGMVQLITGK